MIKLTQFLNNTEQVVYVNPANILYINSHTVTWWEGVAPNAKKASKDVTLISFNTGSTEYGCEDIYVTESLQEVAEKLS